MSKILYKNILALYRYRDIRVGIFYFASPCTTGIAIPLANTKSIAILLAIIAILQY